jgi:hypothetical protein
MSITRQTAFKHRLLSSSRFTLDFLFERTPDRNGPFISYEDAIYEISAMEQMQTFKTIIA